MTLKGLALVLAVVCVSATAFADEPKVEVTSFNYVNNAGRVAELCGKVTGLTTESLARVVVDPNTSNPAIYNAMVGKDGHFCTVVATYRGMANVSLELLGKTIESAPAVANVAPQR